MAGTFEFDAAEVAALMAHAQAAPAHLGTWDQGLKRFGESWIKREVTEAQREEWYKTVPAALWLVKDKGVYLMSNGIPRLPSGQGCVYARGFTAQDLKSDRGEVWDRMQSMAGSDDFVEVLDLTGASLTPGATIVKVELTEDRIILTGLDRVA